MGPAMRFSISRMAIANLAQCGATSASATRLLDTDSAIQDMSEDMARSTRCTVATVQSTMLSGCARAP